MGREDCWSPVGSVRYFRERLALESLLRRERPCSGATFDVSRARGNFRLAPRTKAAVIPLRQLLYTALALVALLAIPALAGAEPCADHGAPVVVAADAAVVLHAVVGTADGSSPCPHRDQRPCKSTCGACVATPAAAPATAPTRLDRPPRH